MLQAIVVTVFVFFFAVLNDSVSGNDQQQSKVCIFNTDCTRDDPSSSCDSTSRKCVCPPKNNSMSPTVLIMIDNKIQCLSGRKIGSGCRVNQECLLEEPKSFCNDDVCRCEKGLVFEKNSCRVNGTGIKVDETNTAILPVMIIMGLMFVGMCAALNMFSKARFKNSRGVFNQPHAARVLKDVQVEHEIQQQRKQHRGDRRYSTRPSLAVDHLDTLDPKNLNPSQRSSQVSVDLHQDNNTSQPPSTPHSVHSNQHH